ncbi:MAG TPA: hypothetical protein PLL71_00680 [Agriterribacter sp.]|nr:hypothetical protein [Agriterribacter sp.]HRQ49341.1 hypothetical protein [Agriterribacter sp.]
MYTYDEKNKPADELDLLVLLHKGLHFFNKFRKILIFFTILGFISGSIIYILLPRVYTSSLMIQSDFLSNTEQVEIIKNWNTLLSQEQYDPLPNQLHCPIPILAEVTKIEAEEIKKGGATSQNVFKVQVWVKDTTILEQLQECIVQGLKNNEYIQSRVTTKRAGLLQLVNRTKEEIGKLDSIKSSIANNIKAGNKSASSFIIDISSVNTQMLSLNEKLVTYENELKFTEPLILLQKFIKFRKPESPKMLLIIGGAGASGIIIGYLIATFIYIKNKLKNLSLRH